MNFKEIIYKRLDMENVQTKAKVLIQEIIKAENQETCFGVVANFNNLEAEVLNTLFLSLIRHYLNVKDVLYEKEKSYYTEKMPIFENLKAQFYAQLLKSPFKESIQERYGELLFKVASKESMEISPLFIKNNQKLKKLFYDFFHLRSDSKIHVRGKDYTMKGVGRLTNSPDRSIRKEALDGFWAIIEEHSLAVDEIFRKVVDIRQEMAEELGYDNYIQLGYQQVKKYDYTPDDMQKFRAQVLQYVTPVNGRLADEQRKRMGYEASFYYDTVSFKKGNAELKGDSSSILEGIQQTFRELSTETATLFDYMLENNWFDFSDNPNKIQGSNFCFFFPKFGYPFINVFFYGQAHNVTTFFHEFGHAFQKLQSLEIGTKWSDYFWAAPDIAEIHSTAMEYFAWNWYPLFLGEDTQKFRYQKLKGALETLVYASIEDEFQHFVYENPHTSSELLGENYRKIERTYKPYMNYDGHTFLEKGGRWRSSTNVAHSPFHHISYALSTVCALQFWKKSQEDFEGAWQDYLRLCKVGGSVGFKEALQIANLKSPFEAETLQEVIGFVEEWLDSVDTSDW